MLCTKLPWYRAPEKTAPSENVAASRPLPEVQRSSTNSANGRGQALLGRDITVFGDGAQTRSFCYVDDLIDGLVRLMKTPDEVTGPINIGNPEELSILQLAAMVIELIGSRSRTVHRPRPDDDPHRRRFAVDQGVDLAALYLLATVVTYLVVLLPLFPPI